MVYFLFFVAVLQAVLRGNDGSCGCGTPGEDLLSWTKVLENMLFLIMSFVVWRSDNHLFKYAQPEDILKYGFIPELIGRMPVIAPLNELDGKTMLSILTEPTNAIIKQYQKLFELENIDLDFTPQALNAIVKKAKKRKTGARALRSIIEDAMLDIMFEAPSKNDINSCLITDNVINEKSKPIYKSINKKSA